MEYIINVTQFDQMNDNKIIGRPKLTDSVIIFNGKNNILVCDNNIELNNASLEFNGNNSLVYLGSNLRRGFKLRIFTNSTAFLGRDADIGLSVGINVFENQNVIIGDDCFIGDYVYISNSDNYPIYTCDTKERINYSNSVYIGDHVYLGHKVYISKGVRIGSGTIIDNASFIPSNAKIPSNLYLSGNPAKIIRNNVFFTKDFLGKLTLEDSVNSKNYKSDVFIYNVVNQETISMTQIDKILKDLDVESRLEFIQKLFIANKRKNRFSI
ncbi:MAG: DapH/DapD/GlmU-related protein [Methanobrevibacter sp.]|uniref:acyltransferase n=1 Tax=Methanobrevibacter sp. TaxID=66852 RepID=UPI002E77B735|nr:DapH/DapD/GlmU-related protein [Methanobrevibacter sp.]MEE0935632.1 DapH/DapD/GlmU-related protein [Methanobrevibacter sp.]